MVDISIVREVKGMKETNEVKGKCKLKPYKSYFAFEIRENNDKEVEIVGGNPVIEN